MAACWPTCILHCRFKIYAKISTYFCSKPTSTAPEQTFTLSLFPSSYSSSYVFPLLLRLLLPPLHQPLNLLQLPHFQHGDKASRSGTLLRFLLPKHIFKWKWADAGGHKAPTTEKPSFMSYDPLSSHMTTATSYLSSPKSQPWSVGWVATSSR